MAVEKDAQSAQMLALIARHRPLDLPGLMVCSNCGWPYPCPTRRTWPDSSYGRVAIGGHGPAEAHS